MKKIIITGALGQIGTELVIKCRERYGSVLLCQIWSRYT